MEHYRKMRRLCEQIDHRLHVDPHDRRRLQIYRSFDDEWIKIRPLLVPSRNPYSLNKKELATAVTNMAWGLEMRFVDILSLYPREQLERLENDTNNKLLKQYATLVFRMNKEMKGLDNLLVSEMYK